MCTVERFANLSHLWSYASINYLQTLRKVECCDLEGKTHAQQWLTRCNVPLVLTYIESIYVGADCLIEALKLFVANVDVSLDWLQNKELSGSDYPCS